MVNPQNNRFDNLVVFVDNQIYARDREQGTRRARVFLIDEVSGDVYRRNNQTWEEVPEEYRSYVFSNICRARENRASLESLPE